MKIKYKNLFVILFIAWTVLWINFTIRDLTKKQYLNDYKILLFRDAAGKRSYAYGDRFFEFLKFCKESLPEGSTYGLVGTEPMSLDVRRTVYYLYPHFKEENPSYQLVLDVPGYTKNGYVFFKGLDPSRFILKRL